MTDPVSTAAAAAATKAGVSGKILSTLTSFSTIIAGLLGEFCALTFIRTLTYGQAMSALFVGGACSFYLTPGLMIILSINPSLDNFIAFLVGMTSMNIVPGVIKISNAFEKNPIQFIKDFLNKR